MVGRWFISYSTSIFNFSRSYKLRWHQGPTHWRWSSDSSLLWPIAVSGAADACPKTAMPLPHSMPSWWLRLREDTSYQIKNLWSFLGPSRCKFACHLPKSYNQRLLFLHRTENVLSVSSLLCLYVASTKLLPEIICKQKNRNIKYHMSHEHQRAAVWFVRLLSYQFSDDLTIEVHNMRTIMLQYVYIIYIYTYILILNAWRIYIPCFCMFLQCMISWMFLVPHCFKS